MTVCNHKLQLFEHLSVNNRIFLEKYDIIIIMDNKLLNTYFVSIYNNYPNWLESRIVTHSK